MAFLRNQMQDQTNQGQQPSNLLSSGQSGVAGTAQTQAGTTGQKSKAQASPNAWYNVSDFLNANQKGGQKLQNTLQTQGQGLVSEDAAKSQESQAGIGSIVRPQVVNYSQDLADTGSEEQVNQGLQQDWLKPNTSYDYSPYQINPNKDITDMQEGSYGALTNFAKTAMPKRTNYSYGAQRMDEALLGRDPSFVQNFAKDLKGQYAAQVVDPLNAKIAEAQGIDTSTDQALDTARQGWFSGLEGYLGGKQSAVDQKLAEQRAAYDAQKNRNVERDLYEGLVGSIDQWEPTSGKNYLNLEDYINQNARGGGYASFRGIDPTKQTAAYSALGDQGVGRYNTLASLLGQNQGKMFDQMSSQKWQDPSWSYRTDDLRRAAQRQAYENMKGDVTAKVGEYRSQLDPILAQINEKQSRIGQLDPRIAELQGQMTYRPDGGGQFANENLANEYQNAYNERAALSEAIAALNPQRAALESQLNPWAAQQSKIMKYLNG